MDGKRQLAPQWTASVLPDATVSSPTSVGALPDARPLSGLSLPAMAEISVLAQAGVHLESAQAPQSKALQAVVRQQALDADLDGLDDIASGIALRRHCHEKIADSRIRHSSSPLDPTTGLAATSAAAFSFAQGVELGKSRRDRYAERAAALTTSRRAGKRGRAGGYLQQRCARTRRHRRASYKHCWRSTITSPRHCRRAA